MSNIPIMVIVWLCTLPFVCWAFVSTEYGITWKQYPKYLRKNLRQIWPLINIASFLLIWVELSIRGVTG